MRFMTMLRATFVATACWLGSGTWIAIAGPPPGFPNLDGFTPVNVDDYVVDMGPRSNNLIKFSSGDGKYGCEFLVYAANPRGDISSPPGCEGRIPATPPGTLVANTPPGCLTTTVAGSAVDEPYLFSSRYNRGCVDDYRAFYKSVAGGNPVLAPGHKLTKGTVTCAALDDASVACLDTRNGSHGFLLSPSGSSAF